jgi:hypothetical protein
LLEIVKNPRTALYGFLSWLIPFVASFAFFGPDGQPWIPQTLFKSIMVVVFGGVGIWLLLLAFRRIRPTFASGLQLGLYWLAINIVLDLAILLPLAGMAPLDYFCDIGLRYLLTPMIAAALGAQADRARLG